MIETVLTVAAVLVPTVYGLSKAIGEGWRQRRFERLVRRAPRVAIASAVEGRSVCLVGNLVDGPPLVAPFTGRRCLHWQVEVRAGDESGGVRAREASPPSVVTIRDDSGRALVDTAGAVVTSDRAAGLRVVPASHNAAAAAAFLLRHRLRPSPSIALTYVFCEIAMGTGDAVAVVGRGSREPDREAGRAERGYRDAPPMILHLSSTRRHPVFITDDPLVLDPDIDESTR